MSQVFLRKINKTDVEYFARWWRDIELLKLTSGILDNISDTDVNNYFELIIKSKTDYHYMIVVNNKTIGHISLSKRTGDWFELQIVIGEKEYWNMGHGTIAINKMIVLARELNISKIFLEVRPTNLAAIKSYEKCGFKEIKIIKYPDNQYLSTTIRMEL